MENLSRSERTRTAEVWKEAEIVRVRIAPEAEQTVEDARENLEACIRLCAEARRPLLVDIRGCRPLEAEVRHTYTGPRLADAFSKLALLVDATPLGRVMGNVYLRVARPPFSVRLFTEEEAAAIWLTHGPRGT